MSKDGANPADRKAKRKRERQARETKNRERKAHEARVALEYKALTAQIKHKRAVLEALIRDPDFDEDSSAGSVRELKREITYLGHALYLLKKTGKSGL